MSSWTVLEACMEQDLRITVGGCLMVRSHCRTGSSKTQSN